MQVFEGYNSSYGREKFGVTVEETDLKRILIEHGVPLEAADGMGITDVFKLMRNEAAIFSRKVQASQVPDEDVKRKLALEVRELMASREKILAAYRPVEAAAS